MGGPSSSGLEFGGHLMKKRLEFFASELGSRERAGPAAGRESRKRQILRHGESTQDGRMEVVKMMERQRRSLLGAVRLRYSKQPERRCAVREKCESARVRKRSAHRTGQTCTEFTVREKKPRAKGERKSGTSGETLCTKNINTLEDFFGVCFCGVGFCGVGFSGYLGRGEASGWFFLSRQRR